MSDGLLDMAGKRVKSADKKLGEKMVVTLSSMAVMKAHSKIDQVGEENVAVEASHKAEVATERFVSRQSRKALHYRHDRPYRRTTGGNKLDFNTNFKRNMGAGSACQKQKIKRQYAKMARDAKKGANTARTAKDVFTQVIRAITHFVAPHKAAVGVIALGILLVMMLIVGFMSVGSMFVGMGNAIFATAYVADDKEINNSDLYYSELETDLQEEIKNVAHAGYDEYRYYLDDIGHNPFELMAYLTAQYDDFMYSEVQSEIKRLFDEQYTFGLEEEVEIRYFTEITTDPDTGETISEEIPYDWYILNVTLTVKPLSEIIMKSLTNDEMKDRYEVYMETFGNRQCYGSPFPFDWHSNVSSPYGYRIHPITEERNLHRGVDIAVAGGTPIQSIQDGTVITATFDSSYGNYVMIEDEKGYMTKYAHCQSISVAVGQDVKRGDIIGKVGNTGKITGNHLHLEALLNGEYLNPYYFVANGGTL